MASAWPRNSWRVRSETLPEAASWVAKVWRRSWKRMGRTPASRQAAWKRLVTLSPSRGLPVCGVGEDEVLVAVVDRAGRPLVERSEEAVGDRDRAAGGEVGFAVGGVFAADPGVADPDALD